MSPVGFSVPKYMMSTSANTNTAMATRSNRSKDRYSRSEFMCILVGPAPFPA